MHPPNVEDDTFGCLRLEYYRCRLRVMVVGFNAAETLLLVFIGVNLVVVEADDNLLCLFVDEVDAKWRQLDG